LKSLSLIMIVKNEEKNIKRCLDSVKDLADEIIIVDTGSKDNTKNIAIKKGAKVYDYHWRNDFSDARNFSIKQSTSDWNLVLDADEYILSNHQRIREFIEKNHKFIGKINILSRYLENQQEMIESSYVSRLFPNRDIFFQGKVHEQLVSNLPRINIDVKVGHDGYYGTDKTDRNLPLLIEELTLNQNDGYILYQIGKQYFLKKDYIKANEYFALSYKNIDDNSYFKRRMVIDYLYSIIKSGTLDIGLKIINMEEKNLDTSPDFHFVCGYYFMELVFSNVNKYISYFPLIESNYKKCLDLGEITNQDSIKGVGSFLALYNLGTLYEATGDIDKAEIYYKKSAKMNYKPAAYRLISLNNKR
jgi:glycosyltransferase involved in cell wall biosynthesis